MNTEWEGRTPVWPHALQDARRGVNLNPGDVAQGIAEMKNEGVAFRYGAI